MSISNEFDVDKVCRTCLQARELKSLYEACSTELCFAEMLASCTALKCYENDGFPKQICQICARALNQSYAFQLKCLEIDRMLRKTLENVKLEEETRIETKIVGKRECEQSSSDEISSNCSDISIEATNLLNNPLKLSEIQEDLDQELELVKHEIEANVKIKTEEDIDISATHLKLVNISEILNESAKAVNDMSFIQTETRKIYPCSVCKKAFNSKTDITRHLRTHTGEKPYSCTLCDKSFNQKINLTRHIHMHTGTKPYSCTICKKLFSQNAHLIRHCEAHTGQKSYLCTLCEKSFHYKSEFTLHTKSHSGMHKYSCSICNKIFSQNSQLVLHIRTHTGEKPYSCTVCDKSFCQKVTLTRHMQTHTLIRPFLCTVCPKSFSRKYVLTVHMRSHTSD